MKAPTTTWLFAALVPLGLAAACGKSDPNADKRMPKLGPPPTASPAAGLHIAVDVDGVERSPIDGARLEQTPADYSDDERKAWRLDRLLGAPESGAAFAVTGENDVTVELRPPRDSQGPVPVLLLSRRGELLATLLDPQDPFPSYHGQGGRLGRPGGEPVRLGGVRRISVRRPAGAPAP